MQRATVIELAAAAMIAAGVAALARIGDVKFAPAMAASRKPGQKSFATPYGTAPRAELSCGVVRNQSLVPLVGIPADITIMMIGDQNIPVFLWLAYPLNHTLASVLDHRARAGAAKHIGPGIDRVVEDVQDRVVDGQFPPDFAPGRSVDNRRERDLFLPEPHMYLPDGPHPVEFGKHQSNGVLDPPVRVLVDPIPADAHVANGNRHEQLTAACLPAERLVGPLPKDRQFHLAHGPFHTEQQAVIGMARIIDPIFIDNERGNQTAKLQQRVPIAAIARQPRGFDRHHRTNTALADPGEKLLETGPCDAGTRAAKIIVDDLYIGPSKLAGVLHKSVLAPFAFKVMRDLARSRLPDIHDGLARQMIRANVTHPVSPSPQTGLPGPSCRARLRSEALP